MIVAVVVGIFFILGFYLGLIWREIQDWISDDERDRLSHAPVGVFNLECSTCGHSTRVSVESGQEFPICPVCHGEMHVT
jgi:hypothetical protein